ncbi:hypothetical protein JL720_9113 [Aureococcus anophagefferens]|nr:hypothetical protein JL720_9113 [Aureococcus anophagefferens]
MIARTRRIATALAFAAVASSTTLSQTQFARLCGAAMRCRRPLELKNRTVILDAPHKVGAGDALAIRGPGAVVGSGHSVFQVGGSARPFGLRRASASLTDCEVAGTGRSAVTLFNDAALTMDGCRVADAAPHGICARGSTAVTLRRSVVANAAVRGIYCDLSPAVALHDVVVSGTRDATAAAIQDKALCELQAAPRFEKELFAFHVAGEGYNMQQWRRYDWSRLTTVAVYGGTNESAKAAWTAGVAENVRRYFADGVNMDTEDAIAPGNRTSRDGLTDMVKRARGAARGCRRRLRPRARRALVRPRVPCVSGTAKDARYCPIAAAPWRDANCTDAKANAVDFSSMPAKTAASVDGAHADAILEQSWMNFVDKDGNVSQLWYDDLASLEAKYRIVKDKGLRGVGVWTANMLDYGPAPSFNDSSKVPQATRDMWTSISTVPFD